MSWVEVKENKYGEEMLLNLDNVVDVNPASGAVLTNGIHGEGTGIYFFDEENMKKIMLVVQGFLAQEQKL